MSQSQEKQGSDSDNLDRYLEEISKLSSRLTEIYEFEEEAELNVRDKFKHQRSDAEDLEGYEEELRMLVNHIQRFENNVGGSDAEFVIKLEEYLYNLSMHQIGENGVRPQHLFIKEAQLYGHQGKIRTAEKLRDAALKTLEILEELNKITLTLINEEEHLPAIRTSACNKSRWRT